MSSNSSDVLRRDLTAAEARENIPKCIEICRRAMADELDSDPRAVWYFGIKLAAMLLTDRESPRAQDVDEAIEVMSRMLTVITRQGQPGYWARLHLQLGGAIARKGGQNEAIRHYEAALEVLRKDKHPEEWALAKKAAGEAYYRLAKDDSISELSRSLEYHRDALTVFTPEKCPDEGLVEAIDMIENVIAKAKELAKKRKTSKEKKGRI
jgi:tetratricopeptide (TPR) repeat protein